MIMASGRPSDIEGARLRVLIDMFRRASEYDPHLREITEGREASHDDGWGYYLAWGKPGGGGEVLYRSPQPVFMDDEGFLDLEMNLRLALDSSWMLLILHSRKASRNKPKTPLDVHPFYTRTVSGGYLVLAHNGGVREESLDTRVEGRSDSLSLALSLSSKRSLQELVDQLEDEGWRNRVAEGGLNIALAYGVEEGEQVLLAAFLHDYKLPGDPSKREAFEKYYSIAGVWGDRFFITMSSTIAELYSGHEVRMLEKGTLVTQLLPLSGEQPGLVEGLPLTEDEEVARLDPH